MGADVSAANGYRVRPISLAAENGNAAILEALLDAGADANAALPEGETVLMTAARTGDADVKWEAELEAEFKARLAAAK